MITRCTRKTDLGVYPLHRDGDNSLDNAQVLCSRCHAASKGYELPGRKPPAFDQAARDAALRRAGQQCECTRLGACHGTGRALQPEEPPGPGASLR